MIKIYTWFNEDENLWQVGDKEELNYLRAQGVKVSCVVIRICSSKKQLRVIEKNWLDRNKTNNTKQA
jgi:hypothetical protein